MKSNVNVFVGVVLCAVLCGTFVWLRSAGDEDTWKPNEIYDQVHSSSYGASYTNATFSASPQEGGLAVSMSSPSSMRARHATNFYAGAHTGIATMPLASSPLASSPMGAASSAGLYATSRAEIKSFGGGGNGGAAMGGAARGNSVSNPSLQGGAGLGFVSSPIAYSTARRGEMSSTSGTNPAMMAAENPAVAAMGAANAANGIYGAYSVMDYSGSANYNQYTGMFGGGRMGVRGRQNTSTGDAWWIWLDKWLATNGSGIGSGTDLGGGYWSDYYFDEQSLKGAYWDFIKNYWNPVMGGDESSFPYEEWKKWFFASLGESGSYTYNGHNYYWMPVGDILPLLLIALLYIVAMYLRSRSRTQVND